MHVLLIIRTVLSRRHQILKQFIFNILQALTPIPPILMLYILRFRLVKTLQCSAKTSQYLKVVVDSGGLGFANADTVVVSSSITVSGNTIAFSNGETITQSTTGAKATIAAINTTAIANTIILQVKPRTTDLTNNSVNAAAWSLSTGLNIVGGTSNATANVISLIGSGATGLVTTDTQGIIQSITLNNNGNNYIFLPTFTVKTSNTTATVGSLSLTPQNYKTVITIANAAVNAIGTGYAFGISVALSIKRDIFLTLHLK